MAKAGRPRAEVPTALVEKLAGIGCTVAEIAAVAGCSKDTLERNFAASIEKGRDSAKASLRRKQWDVAMKGNVGMLIWLGKQLLEQKERHEHTGEGGGPVVFTVKHIAGNIPSAQAISDTQPGK